MKRWRQARKQGSSFGVVATLAKAAAQADGSFELRVVDADRPDAAGRAHVEFDAGAARDFTTRNLKALVGLELGYSTAEMKARVLHHDGAALDDDRPLDELDLRSGDTLTVTVNYGKTGEKKTERLSVAGLYRQFVARGETVRYEL